MKLSLKKLNIRGIAHLVAPLVIVVGVAAVGTFVLVESHADPFTASKSVAYAAKCESTGYPKSMSYTTKQGSITGKLAITNTGTKPFKLAAGLDQGTSEGGGNGEIQDFSTIAASTTHNVPIKQPFMALDKSEVGTTIAIRAGSLQTGNEPAFSCDASIKITN